MEEAALREVREETGLVAKPVESSAMSTTSIPAGARRC